MQLSDHGRSSKKQTKELPRKEIGNMGNPPKRLIVPARILQPPFRKDVYKYLVLCTLSQVFAQCMRPEFYLQ